MRDRVRSIGACVLALLGVVLLGVATALGSAASSPAAVTALINGASGLPKPADKPGYIFGVADHLLAPNTACNAMTNPGCNLVPVNGPETIFPFIGGLRGLTFDKSVAEGLRNLDLEYQAVRAADPDGEIVIFGYSQSGDIVTKQLRNIVKDPNRPSPDQLEFLIVGNTNRPNGGLLSRLTPLYIPFFNADFDGPTPTDTGYQGTDIAFYYDGIADFPTYPLNLLATVNAFFGFLTIHPTYPAPNPALGEYTQTEFQQAMADPANRQTFGDTTFITLPIVNLPILHPFRAIAAKTGTTAVVEPFLDLIEPTLTVLIELGYDRTIPYGKFTTARLFPLIDPIKLAVDLADAAARGVKQAIADIETPATPTPELTQSNPLPFLDPNPFSGQQLDTPPATATTATPRPVAVSRVGLAPKDDDAVADSVATRQGFVTQDGTRGITASAATVSEPERARRSAEAPAGTLRPADSAATPSRTSAETGSASAAGSDGEGSGISR